jgi:hypothetical protein
MGRFLHMRTFGCNKPYMAKRVAHHTAEKSLFVSPSCIMACLSITTRKSTARPVIEYCCATTSLSPRNCRSAYQPTATPYDSETSGSACCDRNSAIKDRMGDRVSDLTAAASFDLISQSQEMFIYVKRVRALRMPHLNTTKGFTQFRLALVRGLDIPYIRPPSFIIRNSLFDIGHSLSSALVVILSCP